MKYLIALCATLFALSLYAQPFADVTLAQPEAATGISYTTATDTFNRSNADPISNPMSDGVHEWTSGPGALTAVKIVSNEAGAAASNAGGRVTDATATFANDQYAEVTVGVGITIQVSPAVRFKSDSDADGYALWAQTSTTLRFYRFDDTGTIAGTILGADVTITALTAGDRIGLKIVGSTLTAYVNDVELATRTDSTHTGGNPGFYLGTSGRITSFFATDDPAQFP